MTVSVTGGQANAYSGPAAISADGRYVAFQSYASNLVAGDTNEFADVFVRDVRTGTTSRVNVTNSGAQATGGASGEPSISADGRYVAFYSYATNLPGGVSAGVVFVRDRVAGTTVRVVPPAADSASDFVNNPSISADGRYVAMTAHRALEPGDTNGVADIYVWERQTGALERVSVTDSGAAANRDSYVPSISGDGRYVVFVSGATNLAPADDNPRHALYLRDRQAGTTTKLIASATAEIGRGRITPDGRYVTFYSAATDLAPRDPTIGAFACFVHDRATGTTSLVSISPTGTELREGSSDPVISADGRWVAFNGFHSDFNEVFLRDRQAGTTVIASVSTAGAAGDRESAWPAISADGRLIAFSSQATTLVRGDHDPNHEVFLRDYRR